MSNPRAKKRKNESSDFKRLKAKVGKRALKPANETNTQASFGTINVGRQNISSEGGNGIEELFSTRGRSLDDIMANLRHPAAAVRISAARGLKDAVTRKEAFPATIRANLAVVVPLCARCTVDEIAEVRQLALEILKETMTKILTLDATQSDASLYMKPFMPLLVAHITSALHSLDRKTQLDGTSMVEMMSLTIPSLIAPFAEGFIPAYSTLLSQRAPSEMKQRETKSTCAKKDSKELRTKSANGESTTYKVLRSLLALLRCINSRRRLGNLSSSADPVEADLTIMPNERSVNCSLFVPRASPTSVALLPLSSLAELISHVKPNPIDSQTGVSSWRKAMHVSPAAATDLLGKLRDAFAEATEAHREKQDLKEVLSILQSVHLFFNCSRNDRFSLNSVESFVKVWRQYTSLTMVQFPYSAGALCDGSTAEVNFEICLTILDAHLDGMDTERDHMSRVLAYVFFVLERCKPSPAEITSTSKDSASVVVSDTLFGALERLLMISRKQNHIGSAGEEIYGRIVKSVASSFFPQETAEAKQDFKVASAHSPLVRKCVLLSREMFSQSNWSIRNDFGTTLQQILRGLAAFLESWGSEFLFETDIVITLMHSVVRRLDPANQELTMEKSEWADNLRVRILPLFNQRRKRCSVFEAFPVALQKKAISLIVVLQSPTQGILDSLAKICSRCWVGSSDVTVSPTIVSLILWAIHSIKRTIPMQSFLGFVTSSMGIAKKPFGNLRVQSETEEEKASVQDILRFDTCVDLVGLIFCQCDPAQVLPLLQPLFQSWLEIEPHSVPTAEKILLARATISILARCLSRFEGCVVPLRDIAPSLDQPALTASCYLLKNLPSPWDSRTTIATEVEAFLEPLALLFSHEGHLCISCFAHFSSEMEALTVTQQKNMVLALTKLTNNRRLFAVLREGSDELVRCAKVLGIKAPGTLLEREVGGLQASLQMLCGKIDPPVGTA